MKFLTAASVELRRTQPTCNPQQNSSDGERLAASSGVAQGDCDRRSHLFSEFLTIGSGPDVRAGYSLLPSYPAGADDDDFDLNGCADVGAMESTALRSNVMGLDNIVLLP